MAGGDSMNTCTSCVCVCVFVQEESSEYGIDWTGPAGFADEAEERVVVPETPNYLSAEQLSLIKTLVNPLQQCDDYGKGLYVATRQLVREVLDCQIVMDQTRLILFFFLA